MSPAKLPVMARARANVRVFRHFKFFLAEVSRTQKFSRCAAFGARATLHDADLPRPRPPHLRLFASTRAWGVWMALIMCLAALLPRGAAAQAASWAHGWETVGAQLWVD